MSAINCTTHFNACDCREAEFSAMRVDAERYRWLRNRNLDAIKNGGVFAGMTPSNVVLNGEDLDLEIDAAMLTPNAVLSGAATEPTTECGASPRPPRTRG